MSSWKIGVMSAAALAAVGSAGCRKEALTDQAQIGATVGEVMASANESASAGTSTAALTPMFRTPDELRGPLWRRAARTLLPTASAAACYPFTFSACASGVRTETFSSCTFGPTTVDGNVTLAFSDSAGCALAVGDSVNRTADFTISGDYGGSLTVTSPGGGQTLTRTATGFDFAVGGIERVLMGLRNNELFDISTETTTPLSITGSPGNLVIVGGTLVITHHLAGYAVSLTPNNLTWASTCNCAVSGSLSGTVSGGKDDGKSATVTLTGCGTADVTIDGDTESVTMDRCGAI
ncbi:MAG TPA: hypothetical protein VMT03_11855 [Polyangia bacterium]|nr:hypothetical protein [Polyangia bacterium]